MIETQRLILRQWKESDVEPFITMSLDQHVMQFFPNLLTPQESLNLIQKISSLINENGWRLAKDFWKQGYATEGAKAALDYGFNILNLDKIVSFTANINTPSQAVMERLGMHKVKNFDHPKVPLHHHLKAHVLYEITSSSFNV